MLRRSMVNYIYIYIYEYTRQSSWNPNSSILGCDRPQHDRPATCVIAQQYSSVILVLLGFHFGKWKFGVHLKKIFCLFYFFNLITLKFCTSASVYVCVCVYTYYVRSVCIHTWQGVIHKEFVPEGETINAVYYKGAMERLLNRIRRVRPGMCECVDRFLLHENAPSHNATIVKQFLAPTKSDCARPPSVFARFSTCWLLFVPKSEIPLEGASLWLDFGHPESRDKYIKHHCNGRLLQRHPEAVWLCKSVCTVRRNVCRKLNNKSVIFFTHFIMPLLDARCMYVRTHNATGSYSD